jgi:hypothetical protein
MRNYTLLLLCLFASTSSIAQKLVPHVFANLPKIVEQSSGLYVAFPDQIWTHADAGSEPRLYIVDSLGTLIPHDLKIKTATNIDWEEVTADKDKGRFYIGDFGNNNNNRKDLRIYVIPMPEILSSVEVPPLETINFSYEDQTDFNAPTATWRFDAEAMIAMGDSIYLFTKPRTSPFSGDTRIYRIPSVGGTHKAIFVASFLTDPANGKGQLTAAALSPQKDKAVLMSNDKLWVFTNFKNKKHFWEGSVQSFLFSKSLQREGVSFSDDCTVYISNEKNNNGAAMLARLNVCNLLTANTDIAEPIAFGKVYPNPSDDKVTIDYQLNTNTGTFYLYNSLGQLLLQKTLSNIENKVDVSKNECPATGVYHFEIKEENNKKIIGKFIFY